MMATILNSAILDSAPAILESDTLIIFLSDSHLQNHCSLHSAHKKTSI